MCRFGSISINASSVNWWLRNPNTGNSNNEYNVNTSGASNNNNANNSNGFVPDCFVCCQEMRGNGESMQCRNPKLQCGSNMQGRCRSRHSPNMLNDARYALSCSQMHWQVKLDTFEQHMSANRSPAFPVSSLHPFLSKSSKFVQMLTPEILADAARKCARGVRWKTSVTTWMFNLVQNCNRLCRSIKTGTYKLSKYIVFKTFDKKPRIIHSTRFSDRVVQRAMCDNGLLEDLCRPLIYENGACLEGKGFTFTFNLVSNHLRKFYLHEGQHTNTGWYVKADVKKFFDSTPHKILKNCVAKTLKDSWMIQQVNDIIDSFNINGTNEKTDGFGTRGVGLGSQISQLLQILVLNGLDHTMKQKFKAKHYIRYMDDILVLVESKDKASAALCEIRHQLEQIGLELNAKSRIGRIQDGFTFLNVNFKLTSTGKVKKKLGKKTIRRELSRLKTLARKLKSGHLQHRDFVQHVNSWFGSNICKMSRGQVKFLRRAISTCLQK